MSELGQFALGIALAALFASTLLGPIGQALGRRLGGKPVPTPGISTGEMTAERVAALEDRIADLEAERALLEERLDFAERMLIRGPQEPQREVESG
jgi:hypothetical protein